jgi:hypothetical protein
MGLTPLVGREAEVALLRERLAQSTDGRGQVVVLSGEAGMAQLRQGIASYRATGAVLHIPYFCTLLAEVSGNLRHLEDSLQALAEAHTLVEQHEER